MGVDLSLLFHLPVFYSTLGLFTLFSPFSVCFFFDRIFGTGMRFYTKYIDENYTSIFTCQTKRATL
jgi:hypothetical protein